MIKFIFSIEFTRLEDINIIFDLSFLDFFNKLKVPTKFVLNTLSISFLETSTAASAQQSIIKSNFGNFSNLFELKISNL
jgi:hypothetical protein